MNVVSHRGVNVTRPSSGMATVVHAGTKVVSADCCPFLGAEIGLRPGATPTLAVTGG